MHLYFAYPEGVENVPTLAKVLAPGTDIRADGGCATLPPSVHSSFRPYYWMRGPALPLPPLPEWVLEQLEQRQRERQERMAERARQMQDPSSFTLQEKLRQCETFLRGVKPAIEGQGGDAQTFYAACAGGDFDLTPAEFYPLLSAWNQRCVPPWDERGLRDKIANAERYRTEPRGIRLHHREAPRAPQAPPPAHEARRDSGRRPNQAEAGAREAPLGIAFRPDDLEPPDVDLLLKDFLDDEYLAGTLAIDGHPLTTRGNAARMCRAFGGRIRYCAQLKQWYMWTGTHWDVDRNNAVLNLACQAMSRMHRMLTDQHYTVQRSDTQQDAEAKEERRGTLIKHIMRSEQPKEIKPALEYASWQRSLSLLPEQMDADDHLVNTASCVVDIRDMSQYQHDPALLQTKITNYGFDKEADCQEWDDFMLWAMGGDEALVRFLQRAAGMSFTGFAREQAFLILWGTGGNGKSTFVNVLKHVAYKYARVLPFEMFLATNRDRTSGPNEELLALKDVRLALASEPDEGRALNESMIKLVTGGEEVTARPCFGKPVEFKPKFTMWLSCNEKPVIKGMDNGIWRRVMLVPFTQTVTEAQKDTGKAERMLAREGEGILTWCLRGAKEWYHHGLNPPEQVRAAVDEYRESMDIIGAFLRERCIVNASVSVPSADLYREYERWSEEQGERYTLSHKKLTQRLRSRGITVEKGRTSNAYVGVTLKGH
jgi:putative DNA primase/helicase